MLCQECNKNPSTVHFTKIVNGKKAEFYLCESCMKEMEGSLFHQQATIFSINPLLAGLLNQEQFLVEQQPVYTKQEALQCSKCNMTYQRFLNVGKFGCAECYKVFDKQLTSVLRRIHSGNEIHIGKVPKRTGEAIQIQREIYSLKNKLEKQVLAEKFEEAAETRDAIKYLEEQLHDY